MSERFELSSELTIYTAMETSEALLSWVKERTLKDGAPLKISAKNVSAIDGSGLQLLVALSNMDVTWQLVDTSEEFASACRLMGMKRWLDSPYLLGSSAGENA